MVRKSHAVVTVASDNKGHVHISAHLTIESLLLLDQLVSNVCLHAISTTAAKLRRLRNNRLGDMQPLARYTVTVWFVPQLPILLKS